MFFLGGKGRIADEILGVMLPARGDRVWVEPFVGAGNVIHRVPGSRIGNDKDADLVELLAAVGQGYVPPREVSFEMYQDVKNFPEKHPPELRAFVSFGCSFSGKKWGGYARKEAGSLLPQSYAKNSSDKLVRMAPGFVAVDWRSGDYQDTVKSVDGPALIYCDPPYAGTTKYKSGAFDSDAFWKWCEALTWLGHRVYVSEYDAPARWRCVWEKELKVHLNGSAGQKRVERLFTYAP